MQSKSAPKKKTSKVVTEATPVVEASAVPASKPRSSRSSKPKSEPAEGSSAKRHRKPQPIQPAEEVAANTEQVSSPRAIELVAAEVASTPTPSEAEIRNLAYHFWIERGRPHGSHQEDWVRAEKTLKASA